jgi:hypothetical protein
MDDQAPPLVNEPASDAATRSLAADLRQLAEDGRTFVEAELAYHKSRAAVAGVGARGVAGWGALALALVFFALMALVVGALLALAPLLGGWGAMLAVTLALLLLATLAGWTALRRWRKMQALLRDQP